MILIGFFEDILGVFGAVLNDLFSIKMEWMGEIAVK